MTSVSLDMNERDKRRFVFISNRGVHFLFRKKTIPVLRVCFHNKYMRLVKINQIK